MSSLITLHPPPVIYYVSKISGDNYSDTGGAIGNRDNLFLNLWFNNKTPLDFILKAYFKNTNRVGLLRLAGFWCAVGQSPSIDLSDFKPIEHYETNSEKLAVMLIKMTTKNLSNIQELIDNVELVTHSTDFSAKQARLALLECIKKHSKHNSNLSEILRKLINYFDDEDYNHKAVAYDTYSTMIQMKGRKFDSDIK